MKNLLLETAIFIMLRILFYQTSQIDLVWFIASKIPKSMKINTGELLTMNWW